jgi:murein DD-endopeptidase MepM/ murein hydrolase activator NlpD
MIRFGLVAALALGAALGAPVAAPAQDRSEFVRKPVAADAGRTAAAQAAANSEVAGRRTRAGFGWPATGRVVMGFCEDPDQMNIVVPSGGAVRAAEAGTVAYAGNALKGYRNLILIRHRDDWASAYTNADVILVKRGDIVARGQAIARIGDGSSPLHFELRHRSVSVDPRLYLEGADTHLVEATKRESCG